MGDLKIICFDMDGTIADLYGVDNWLTDLRRYSAMPYRKAEPMWDTAELNRLLNRARAIGYEVRIITWLSKESNPAYDEAVRQAKRDWLSFWGFPYDHFHGVAYGTTKANCIRKYLDEGETAILFDDNAKVRNGWRVGNTYEPSQIIEILKEIVGE